MRSGPETPSRLRCSASTGRYRRRPPIPSGSARQKSNFSADQLDYFLLPERFHLLRADPEAAEDLGVVLAELGRHGAHPNTLADLDRGADMRHLAQLRVACILHEAAVADLRVGEHLRIIVDWA